MGAAAFVGGAYLSNHFRERTVIVEPMAVDPPGQMYWSLPIISVGSTKIAYRGMDRDSPTSIWRATNFQRINWSGAESSLTYRLRDGQSLNFQYTYLHGAQDQLGEMQSKYSFNYPIHAGLASWQGMLPHHILTRIRVGAMERYAREPYAVVDAYAALVRGRVRPFLQLTNISGTAYQEIQGVPMPGRGIVGGLDVLIYPSR